ncbi:YhcN/YlaJ family sporulation lipoprotein [Radiobacillus sp. PE A8.2]|uniref:YhcN/YlaJ family sporulation lipoprotein n=1 Tax=Radiobacillus sp. PE A8.2 TaxID=3380349 RepID=UPI0038907C77
MNKIWILGTLFVLVACQNDNEQADIDQTAEYQQEPIGFQSESDMHLQQVRQQQNDNDQLQEEYLEGYQDDLRRPDSQANDSYSKSFYNETSQQIAEFVNQMNEVKLTQAFLREDSVIVAVMLDQRYYDEDIAPIINEIEKRVGLIVTDKEVIIQTDAIYWNQMRDLDAKEGIE